MSADANAPSFTNLDPNTLPPEVRSFYDSMLADYRRKTEEVAEFKKKATLLDSAATDPIMRGQLIAALQGLGGEAPATETQETRAAPAAFDGVNPAEFFDEPTFKHLQAFQHQWESQKLSPIVQAIQEIARYKPFIDQLMAGHTDNTWSQLETKYPQAKGQRDAVASFQQKNPGLTHEQALFAVLGAKLAAPAGTTANAADNPTDKRAALTRQNAPSIASQPTKRRVSLADLIRKGEARSR